MQVKQNPNYKTLLVNFSNDKLYKRLSLIPHDEMSAEILSFFSIYAVKYLIKSQCSKIFNLRLFFLYGKVVGNELKEVQYNNLTT